MKGVLWQFHNVSNFESYKIVLEADGVMKASEQAVKEGKVLHAGISSHSLDVALKAVFSDLFETLHFPLNFIWVYPLGA